MKIVCAPQSFDFRPYNADLEIDLFSVNPERSSVGQAVYWQIHKNKLQPCPKAWDLLSIALSIIAADLAVSRVKSPDGWTRRFDLTISTSDSSFWNREKELVEKMVRFLSTDIWNLTFVDGGFSPKSPKKIFKPTEDCVTLLSGGLDSLIGAIDLVADGFRPYAVSQTVTGDGEKQRNFAASIGKGLSHIQLNHNANVLKQDSNPPSQRTRSLIFLAYGVILATSLQKYEDGGLVTLFMSENGLISINPPLTGSRIGSLSTRTTHPIFIKLFQTLLERAAINVKVENRYTIKTKGEMLIDAKDQSYLLTHAHTTTSCGRFGVHGRKHCGRCIPCLIRRSAFLKWGIKDDTDYVYQNLSIQDYDHMFYDDVRSAGMAIVKVQQEGIRNLVGASLNTYILGDISELLNVAERGLEEVKALLEEFQIV